MESVIHTMDNNRCNRAHNFIRLVRRKGETKFHATCRPNSLPRLFNVPPQLKLLFNHRTYRNSGNSITLPPRTIFGTTTKSIPLHLRNETRKEIDSISLPRNPAFRFSFRMDGWMDGSQYHETRGGITLLLWLNLLWNRVERKGREGVSDGRDITNFCKMLPNSPVPWPRGIYIYIYTVIKFPSCIAMTKGYIHRKFKQGL